MTKLYKNPPVRWQRVLLSTDFSLHLNAGVEGLENPGPGFGDRLDNLS